MQVSILYAFVAGIISFLSPCVLPLVPGYVSMLSGIGVEQLRTGQPARNSLFASSLAFVSGFSVVFISFGASASAVGQFLLQHKALMGPVAGAMIVLFGLHLVGWLIKIARERGTRDWRRAGSWRRDSLPALGNRNRGSRRPVRLRAIAFGRADFSCWTIHDAMAQPRRPLPQSRQSDRRRSQSRRRVLRRHQRFSAGLRVCLWLDAVHRPDSRRRPGAGCEYADDFTRRFSCWRSIRRAWQFRSC